MSENITDRLRCRYALGPIMANGEPEFGWRDFSGPAPEGMMLPTPLMLEAAEAIAAKDAEIARLREALTAIEAWDAPLVESRGKAVSMSVKYGSNGVRDYFRGIARAALAQEQGGSDDI